MDKISSERTLGSLKIEKKNRKKQIRLIYSSDFLKTDKIDFLEKSDKLNYLSNYQIFAILYCLILVKLFGNCP
jgi:hypothetical protein